MAYRFYLMPKAGTGTESDPYRMSYIDNANGTRAIVGPASGMDYGVMPTFLVAADVTPAEHTAISAHADVVSVPAVLTNTVGANLATTQAALEGKNIPAEWITAGMTWKAVLLWLTRLFQFAQRYNGLFATAPFLDAQTNLDLPVNQVPQAARDRYAETAQSFGFNSALITGSMTIRQVLAQVLLRIPDGNLANLLKAV